MYDAILLTADATFHFPDTDTHYALHKWRAFARLEAGDPTGPTIARFQCGDSEGHGWWWDLETREHARDVVELARKAIRRHRFATSAGSSEPST